MRSTELGGTLEVISSTSLIFLIKMEKPEKVNFIFSTTRVTALQGWGGWNCLWSFFIVTWQGNNTANIGFTGAKLVLDLMGRCKGCETYWMRETVLPNEDSASLRWQQHVENHRVNVTLLKAKEPTRSDEGTRFWSSLQSSSSSLCVFGGGLQTPLKIYLKPFFPGILHVHSNFALNFNGLWAPLSLSMTPKLISLV